MSNSKDQEEIKRLKDLVESLTDQWRVEHRTLEILRAAGFVTETKIKQARELAESFKAKP